MNLNEYIQEQMKNPEFKQAYDDLAPEYEIIRALVAARIEQNMTQKELGKILGVNISSVQKYESGAVSNLKMETLRKLCDYFDLSPIVFVFPEDVELESLLTGRFVNGRYFDHTKTTMALNDEGVHKVLEYAADLLASGNYPKK